MIRSRILLVDDHPIVREGILRLIRAESDLEVAGDVGTAIEALDAVRGLKPDLVIVDLSLGNESGLELIHELGKADPQPRVLVLSMHAENDLAPRALRAGAHGYVMKSEATDKLLAAIRRVLTGELYVSETVNRLLLESVKTGRSDPLGTLTDRELEVLRLIGAGRTTREIGKTLGISTKTVETHRSRIKEKLEMRGNAELVARAALWMERGEF